MKDIKIVKCIEYYGYNFPEVNDFILNRHYVYPQWVNDYGNVIIAGKMIYKGDYIVADEQGNIYKMTKFDKEDLNRERGRYWR